MTKALPGPKILSLSARIQYQTPARQWPVRRRRKHVLHAAQLRRVKDLIGNRRGEHSTTLLQPAIRAGVASIIPLRRAGRSRQEYTTQLKRPTRDLLATYAWLRFYIYRRQFCAVWKVSIFFTATVIACFSRRSGVRWLQRSPQQTPSARYRGFIKLRAVFPQGLIATRFPLSRISLTVRVMLSEAEIAGALTAGVVAPQYSYSSQ